ncbi:response regulator [Desulfobotulus sp. H1]|uniref:Response regulator n=1 Tax=Desulfobotulus pelophilus TaxID=2823377 RepID=A0ABT3NAN1_9BACT|nr:response regulator [Desulfobotulus pelophilus]MCW7754521.1 response regulator [Desulfobotulus pelophilus]
MQEPKVHIFWESPLGREHLSLWLKKLGYSPAPFSPSAYRNQTTADAPIIFSGPGHELPAALPGNTQNIHIGREPGKATRLFLKTPVAPRALAHLLAHLDHPEKIHAYSPGIPTDFMDMIPWLDTLTPRNAPILLPELFQYLDDRKADTAILPLLTEKVQVLLNSSPELILLGLEQGGYRTRRICARTAGSIRLNKALPILMHLLTDTDNSEEGEILIRALGHFPDAMVRRVLHKEALGEDTLRALAAIECLGAIHRDNDSIALLSDLIEHPEGIRAVNAANALAAAGTPEGYTALAAHLHPDDAVVRKEVATLLVRGGEKAIQPIIQAMKTASTPGRVIGCLILGYTGLTEAIDSLCIQLRHKDANVRFSACEALGRIPSEKTFLPLSAALEDTNADVVCAAITGLNLQHPKTGARAVRQALLAHPHRSSTLIAAMAAMQATALFIGLSEDRKLTLSIIKTAAESRNTRLLHRFLEACSSIPHSATRQGCEHILRKAIDEIPAERPRILVTDDSPTMRRFYETLLPQYGYTVETARDGLNALARIQPDPSRFALLLTDLNMPNKNGIELTRLVREELGQEFPILMVSTETLESQKKAAFEAGVTAFLSKPFTTADLVWHIRKLLRSE